MFAVGISMILPFNAMAQPEPETVVEPVYDASDYFGAGTNDPADVWTWRGKWEGRNNLTRDGQYTLLPDVVEIPFPSDTPETTPGWSANFPSTDGYYLPAAWRFQEADALDGPVIKKVAYRAQPGTLMLHPGSGRLVTATWKAPRSGMISLAAQFQDAAQGAGTTDTGVAWFIQLGSRSPLAQGLLPAGATSALIEQQSLLVAEGDLLHFGVDPRGACLTDATSVIARVSYGAAAAPAPGRRLDDAPPEAPATAQRLLPGGDQTLRYGGGSSDFVVLKGGTDVVDWPVGSGSSAANYVASSILAFDQALRYDLSGTTVLLKGGTLVTFRYFSPLTTVPGYVASGTLSSAAPAQVLPYGYEAGYTLNFQPGSLIAFIQYKTSGITANGYETSGTAGQAQSVYFGYQSGASLTVQPGSLCTFKHSPTTGSAQSGYLLTGRLHTDAYLPYGYSGGTVKIRGGQDIVVRHFKYPGSACNGYLSGGRLAENSNLPYGLGTNLLCAVDTLVDFRYAQTASTLPTSTGYLASATPAANATVKFGSQAGATLTILAGKPARFSLLGTQSINVPGAITSGGQAGFLDSATAASSTPLSLPYSVSTPVRYATVQTAQNISFARISTNATTTNSNGYLTTGLLAFNQTIYKPNGTTVSGPDGATLIVYIPSSGTGGVNLIASNLLLTDTDSDGMTDGFEYFYNLNPLSAADAATDLDFDGVSNLWEYRLGTHPRQKDSNGNGIEDGAEDQDADGLATSFEPLTSLTNPNKNDTDGDRLPDGWEYRNNLNPNSGADNDGRAGDPDGDGLTNLLEYLNGTNPFLVDSDFDGTSDIIEINQAGNPNNSNDGGLAPAGPVKEVSVKLGGDYTSWEMLITGKGPGDDRLLKVITPSPGDAEIVSHKLRPGNTYEISLTYTGTKAGETQKWYCWESLIDALPNAITFPDYTSTRVPAVGEFFTVGGGSWLVDNRSGLLSGHSHHNEKSGGNPTAGLVASLLPVEFVQPRLDQNDARILDAAGHDSLEAVQKLRLCRWYQAHGWRIANTDENPRFKLDFHPQDNDRFHIRILGVDPGPKIKLKTSGLTQILKWNETAWQPITSDAADEITMSRPEPQKAEWLSEPLILTDGDDDASYRPRLGGGTDDQPDDPTHAAGLDSTVTVTFPGLGEAETSIKTVTAMYDVKARNLVFSANPLTQFQADRIQESYNFAREVYRPHRFTITHEMLPPFQNAEMSSLISTIGDKSTLQLDTLARLDQFGAALKASGATSDRLNVVWLPGVEQIKSQNSTSLVHAAGVSGSYFTQGIHYYWIAIETLDYRPRCLAHEIGHGLGLSHTSALVPGHLIMGNSAGNGPLFHYYNDRKRLNFEEERAGVEPGISPSPNEGAEIRWNADRRDFCTKLP